MLLEKKRKEKKRKEKKRKTKKAWAGRPGGQLYSGGINGVSSGSESSIIGTIVVVWAVAWSSRAFGGARLYMYS